MQTFVLFDLVRLQAYDLSNSVHNYLLSPRLSASQTRERHWRAASELPAFIRPRRTVGIGVGGNGCRIHRHTIPRRERGHIVAIFDDGWMHKMLMQVGCV